MNIKSVDACFRANFYYLAFFFIFLVRMWAFCLEKYMPAVYKKKKKNIKNWCDGHEENCGH